MKRIIIWIIDRPVVISSFVFLFLFLVLYMLTSIHYNYDKNFIEGIFVEAHGMILDVIVFGILILWLNQLNGKRRTVRGYKNEIEFFRGWESEEGVRRTVGNIKLLVELGVRDLDLKYCCLKGANFENLSLEGANLEGTNLEGANLKGANLKNAHLGGANLKSANLDYANLTSTFLLNAELEGTSFIDIQGENTIWELSHLDLYSGDLMKAKFHGYLHREHYGKLKQN
jgi:hypothetical protein